MEETEIPPFPRELAEGDRTQKSPPDRAVVCAMIAQRTRQRAGSIETCQASPFPSLCLTFCLCEMGRLTHKGPDGLPGATWGSHGTEAADLSPGVAF